MSETSMPEPSKKPSDDPKKREEIRIYGHNMIFYWWPVWLVGFVLTVFTWVQGEEATYTVDQKEGTKTAQVSTDNGEGTLASEDDSQSQPDEGAPTEREEGAPAASESASDDSEETAAPAAEDSAAVKAQLLIHPSKTLGLIWILVFFVILVFTHFHLRGIASAILVLLIILTVLSLQLLGVLDDFFASIGLLAVHMNLGFFLVTSLGLFVLWGLSFYFFDRFTYWKVSPGQITECHLIGEGQTTYDARGMVVEKVREDIFRNWILGFGSGNLELSLTGARKHSIIISDVLKVGDRVDDIQRLVSIEPAD